MLPLVNEIKRSAFNNSLSKVVSIYPDRTKIVIAPTFTAHYNFP
jgi:hypothetical protein